MTTPLPGPAPTGSGLRGTWYILPTPFDVDGALDVGSLARLTGAAIDWGIDGLTAMGVMAEPGSLSADERELALRTIVDAAAGQVPIAVGCSGPTVDRVVALADQARRLGAVAAMVAPPTLLRNVDLLPDFYRAVGSGAGLPLIIQDEPAATGVVVPVSTLVACLAASAARTVKLEDPPTPAKIGRLLAAVPGLAVFGGLGGAAALWELQRGACGTMTGFAFPEVLRAIRLASRVRRCGSRRAAVRPVPAAARLRGAADRRAGDPQGGPAPTRCAGPCRDARARWPARRTDPGGSRFDPRPARHRPVNRALSADGLTT